MFSLSWSDHYLLLKASCHVVVGDEGYELVAPASLQRDNLEHPFGFLKEYEGLLVAFLLEEIEGSVVEFS